MQVLVNAGFEQPQAVAPRLGTTTTLCEDRDAGRQRAKPSSTRGGSDALTSCRRDPDAVGHRVVHGGERFTERGATRPELSAAMRCADRARSPPRTALSHSSAPLDRRLPDTPHVACFDMAFHATLPEAAGATRAGGLADDWAHAAAGSGLSRLAAGRAGELAGSPRRVVSCHLGAGASLCAVLDGHSVGHRWASPRSKARHGHSLRFGRSRPPALAPAASSVTSDAMADALERRVGPAGPWPATSDMRELLARRRRRAPGPGRVPDAARRHRGHGRRARRARRLVFTGGIGEDAPPVRELACVRDSSTSASRSTASRTGCGRRRRLRASRRSRISRRARGARSRGPTRSPARPGRCSPTRDP